METETPVDKFSNMYDDSWIETVNSTTIMKILSEDAGYPDARIYDEMDTALYYNSRSVSYNDFSEKFYFPNLKTLAYSHIYNLDPHVYIDFRDGRLTSHVRKCCDDSILRRSASNDSIFSIFTIGKSNHAYCAVGISGDIFFIPTVLSAYWTMHGKKQKTIDLINKTLDIISKLLNTYSMNKSEEISKTPSELLSISIMKLLKNNRLDIRTFDLRELLAKINDSLSSLFECRLYRSDSNNWNVLHHMLLCNQNVAYKNLIGRYWESRRQLVKDAYSRGMSIGVKLFSELSRVGYKYDEKNEYWFKDVHIKPELCYHSGKLWRILPEYQEYYINKLTIDLGSFETDANKFHINACGKHPNVHENGTVCLGDLNNNWVNIMNNVASNKTKDDVYCFLIDIEESLTIPNFDSSYFQMPDFRDKVTLGVRDCTKMLTDNNSPKRWTELQ